MTDAPSALARYTPAAAVAVLLAGALLVGVRFGAPAVVLWLAFAALAGAILLFWESLRTALDPGAPADETLDEAQARAQAELEARKTSALRALKDLEFERSIGRLSDEDFAQLDARYRAEARAAMAAADQGLGDFLERAEALIDRASRGEAIADEDPASRKNRKTRKRDGGASEPSAIAATAEEPARVDDSSRPRCSACATVNDADAAFCKRCGARVAAP